MGGFRTRGGITASQADDEAKSTLRDADGGLVERGNGTPMYRPTRIGAHDLGYNKELSARWDAYQNALKYGDFDSLGVPWAEQQEMVALAQQQAMAGQQGAISDINRSALAGQDFQAGAFAKAAGDATDRGSDAAAKAASSTMDLNARLVQARVDALRSEMLGERNYQAEQAAKNIQMGVDALAAVGEIIPA